MNYYVALGIIFGFWVSSYSMDFSMHRFLPSGKTIIIAIERVSPGLLLDLEANKEVANEWGIAPLHLAVLKGQSKRVEFLLASGSNIEAVDCEGRTPLHHASLNGQSECLKVLLLAGADTEAVNREGRTPLHLAAVYDQSDCLNFLVMAKAKKDAVDKRGNTPLHLAALFGGERCVKLLVDLGANKEATDENGLTPLYWAVRNGEEHFQRLWCEEEQRIMEGKKSKVPPYLVVLDNPSDCAQRLLKSGANHDAADKEGHTLLHIISSYQNPNVYLVNLFKQLLERKADVNAQTRTGMTPLMICCTEGRCDEGNYRVLKLLLASKDLKRDIRDHTWGGTALHWAVKRDRFYFCPYLIESGFSVESKVDSLSMLHLAVLADSKALVSLFLTHQKDLNAEDKDGKTPLYYACSRGDRQIVALFLQDHRVRVDDKTLPGKITRDPGLPKNVGFADQRKASKFVLVEDPDADVDDK